MSAATTDDVLELARQHQALEELLGGRIAALAGEVVQRADDQAAKLEEILELLGPLCETVARLEQTLELVEQLARAVGPMLADPSGPMRLLGGLLGAGRAPAGAEQV